MDTPERTSPRTPIRPVDPYVAAEGIPGFHPHPSTAEAPAADATGASSGAGGDAAYELDPDVKGRVDTGTGDQPGNTRGARTGTPPPDDPQ
ncbi:MAG: hypothetical protein JST66_14745 [Bacteroidetes bacterium]|nr:hypothetical protein [Bacteroidota bacterium]